LKVLKEDLEKNYYDPAFRGLDLQAHFKKAEEKISSAASTSQVLGIIAQVFVDLNDSHTLFFPPERASRIEYGWRMQMIGDQCYVVAIKPGSDAEAKGLKVGDRLLSVNGFEPTRQNLWMMHYGYYMVRPQPGMRLVIGNLEGQESQLDVMAKVTPGKQVLDLSHGDIWEIIREAEKESRLYRNHYYEVGDELVIWKMPSFDMSTHEVDNIMNEVCRFKALILDLRGNSGGSVRMLERLAGYFFDDDLKIAELKGRRKMDPIKADSQSDRIFKGKLIVLVDSQSASASEIFARLVQLERRGTVIGDRTAGAVMQAEYFSHKLGIDRIILYGASITNADVIMSDGKSLEHVGVTPDELLLPNEEDLASERDPAMARAAALAGIEMNPNEAGTLFPIEWQ